MDVVDLFVASTISNQPVVGSIILSASRECVLAGVLIVKGVVSPDPHKPLLEIYPSRSYNFSY
jgi:hypothetical protein